jgi:hypothetical protein
MFERLQSEFQPVLHRFMNSSAMRHLANGLLTIEEYKSFLTQVYFYAREDPQLQALATVYFRGRQRDFVKAFYSHASSEIGHEQLALNDLQTLGADVSATPYRNALPATTALTGFAFHQIYNGNPLGYLGYLYFLEFVPTQAGPTIAQSLSNAGVPEAATTFLRDHIEIDVAHNRLMTRYADSMLKSDADIEAVVYAMKTTGYLYAAMIGEAIADVAAPMDTGWNWAELSADGLTPRSVQSRAA